MNVERYMQQGAVTALPTASLSTVREVMEEHGFGLLLVASEDGCLKGFVTRASLKGTTDWDAPVEQITHPAVFAVSPCDTLEKAALILLENRLVLLPVTTEDGRLVGILTQAEVLRGLAEGLGIGLEGTRLSVRLREDSDDIYRVLELLRAHDVRLVSFAAGSKDGTHPEAILRVQGIDDRVKLCEELEARLRESES
ncbi:MAG: CBS domain-containing protein [Candidatus Bipolaricaulia bacterium]